MGCYLWISGKYPGQAEFPQTHQEWDVHPRGYDATGSGVSLTSDFGGASSPDYTRTRLRDAGIGAAASVSQPYCGPHRHSETQMAMPTPAKQPPQASPMTQTHPVWSSQPEYQGGMWSSQPEIRNLGPREPLSTLANDFKYNESFCNKIAELESVGYRGWRRIRGDGNCFYRCIAVGLLEALATANLENRIRWSITLLRQFWGSHLPQRSRGGGASRAPRPIKDARKWWPLATRGLRRQPVDGDRRHRGQSPRPEPGLRRPGVCPRVAALPRQLSHRAPQ
eukprot:NODE_9723_length_1403_cov_3.534483.p1 GENE.NODE_9723_length_1403_cov_3.534483~~NODE_9723_length_1403_cov_3.534483.p1  ORF type:complete len:280 (+),score=10.13 NODE_9723_length_1403_cov_3.534483:104-943(+)